MFPRNPRRAKERGRELGRVAAVARGGERIERAELRLQPGVEVDGGVGVRRDQQRRLVERDVPRRSLDEGGEATQCVHRRTVPQEAPGTLARMAVSRQEVRDTAAHRLRGVGQRLTSNREALVDTLADATRPLTIPEILDRRKRLAQSSVYRNLVVLEDAGIVHRVLGAGEFARWELAEDLTGHHHHLICAVVRARRRRPGVSRARAIGRSGRRRHPPYDRLPHRAPPGRPGGPVRAVRLTQIVRPTFPHRSR